MDVPRKPPELYSMTPVPPASAELRQNTIPSGYKSPRLRARFTLALLGATLVVQVFSLFALIAQRSLLNRGVAEITVSEWHTSTSRVSLLAVIELILFGITAAAFLYWLHRCYVNLAALGERGVRFSPGWAVGYWLIPVLNLFRPKQILDELWRATASPKTGDQTGAKTSLPALWLLALLTSALTSRIGAGIGQGTVSDLARANAWLIVSCVADIGAAALLYYLVNSLTARQEHRATT